MIITQSQLRNSSEKVQPQMSISVHITQKKKYAIKLLKDIPIAHSSFIQETKSLNEISHPNITNIIRSGISKIYSNDKIIDNPYIL